MNRLAAPIMIVLVLSTILLRPVPTRGQIVAFYRNAGCVIDELDIVNQQVNLTIFANGVGMRAIRFSIPEWTFDEGVSSQELIPGASVQSMEGDFASGFTLHFDCGDYPQGITLATLSIRFFFGYPLEPCFAIPILPHPAATTGEVELIGCDDSATPAFAGYAFVIDDGNWCGGDNSGFQPPPQLPDPPNLAESVPLDHLLGWVQPPGWQCFPALYGADNRVYLGTTSPPASLRFL